MPPGFTGIGLAGYFHPLFFGVVLPRAAIRSAKLMDERPLPPRRKHFVLVLIQQAVLVGLSLLVAYAERINLFPRPQHLSLALPLTLTFLAACLALMWTHWRRNVLQRERKAYFFMSRDKSEKFIWVAIALTAEIGEELPYRGVLYTLLMRLATHLVYDLTAGLTYSHFGETLNYPLEGIEREFQSVNANKD